jgi:hypothetical protein
MSADILCERAMLEISVAHDEHRAVDEWVADHLHTCDECSGFATRLAGLDSLLAPGEYDRVPDLAGGVIEEITRPLGNGGP